MTPSKHGLGVAQHLSVVTKYALELSFNIIILYSGLFTLKNGKFLKEYNSRWSINSFLILNKFLLLKINTEKIAIISKNFPGSAFKDLDK